MNGQNLTTFRIPIIIYKIYVSIVNRHFRKFATELRPLIGVIMQFLFNILRMNGPNLTKISIHIIIDKIYVGNLKVILHFSQNYNLIIDKIYVGIVTCHFSQI